MSGVLGLVLLLSGASAARAAEVPVPFADCSIHHPATFFARLDAMPPAVQSALEARTGPLAEPGEAFDSTDARGSRDPTPTRQFVGGIDSGAFRFVWYRHGGYGVHLHVVAFVARLVAYHTPGVPIAVASLEMRDGLGCVATDAILDGVLTSQEW